MWTSAIGIRQLSWVFIGLSSDRFSGTMTWQVLSKRDRSKGYWEGNHCFVLKGLLVSTWSLTAAWLNMCSSRQGWERRNMSHSLATSIFLKVSHSEWYWWKPSFTSSEFSLTINDCCFFGGSQGTTDKLASSLLAVVGLIIIHLLCSRVQLVRNVSVW